ncbi:MAG: hypothetical protein HFG58_07210 [Lachnospiraceae bacterium]|nr:hypothetical protein [Lachnospiraceae bacterium]
MGGTTSAASATAAASASRSRGDSGVSHFPGALCLTRAKVRCRGVGGILKPCLKAASRNYGDDLRSLVIYLNHCLILFMRTVRQQENEFLAAGNLILYDLFLIPQRNLSIQPCEYPQSQIALIMCDLRLQLIQLSVVAFHLVQKQVVLLSRLPLKLEFLIHDIAFHHCLLERIIQGCPIQAEQEASADAFLSRKCQIRRISHDHTDTQGNRTAPSSFPAQPVRKP